MKKLLIGVILVLSAFAVDAQKRTVITDIIKVYNEFWLGGRKVTSIETDSTFTSANHNKIPTVKAVKDYVAANGAGISALTGDVSATGTGSVVATIAAGAVTGAKIATGAVSDSTKVAANAITTTRIADGAVWAVDLAANAVITAKIANSAVTGAKLATGAVSDSTKMGTNVIEQSNIDNGSVWARHLASMGASNGQVLGYNGTRWGPVAAGSGWGLTGNAPTAGSSFLGTTNNVSLRIRTNNSQKVICDSLGNFGIGVNLPLARFHNVGSGTTSSTVNFVFNNSAGTNIIGGLDNGYVRFGNNTSSAPRMFSGSDASSGDVDLAGKNMVFRSGVTTEAALTGTFLFTGTNMSHTSGAQSMFRTSRQYALAAGNASPANFAIDYSINNPGAQTGVLTGLTVRANEINLNGIGHNLFDITVNSNSIFRVANNGWVGMGTTTMNADVLDLQAKNSAQITGSELSTTGTGTNWTGTSFVLGYTHTPGSTAPLIGAFSVSAGWIYAVTYVITGRTAGLFNVTMGGLTVNNSGPNGTYTIPQAFTTTTGALTLTPTTDFDGTVTFTVKRAVVYPPAISLKNSTGSVSVEIRVPNLATNTFMGREAGGYAASDIGEKTFYGYYAGGSSTRGGAATSIGAYAAYLNTIGSNYVAVGSRAGVNTTTSSNFVALGYQSGNANSTGSSWTAIGYRAGFNNTIYDDWIAIGRNAAPQVHFQNGIYIGGGVAATEGVSGTPTTNEVVIGHLATGGGSNTVTIGNTSITKNQLFGNLGVSSTAITPAARLHLVGSGATSATWTLQAHNNSGNNNGFMLRDDGRTGLGTATLAAATLTIAAGTTTTAPLNIPAGTNTSTIASGNIENNGTDLQYSPDAFSRYVLIKGLSGTSPSLDFPAMAQGTGAVLTFTDANAASGDIITIANPFASGGSYTFTAGCSTSGTIWVNVISWASGTSDPSAANFKYRIIK